MRLFRNVGILVLVLALLVGVYYYGKTHKKDEKPEDNRLTVFDVKREDILQMDIQTGKEHIIFAKEGEDWKLKLPEINGIKLSKTDITSLVYDVSSISADQVVEEEATDLEKYGLKNPAGMITVTLADGTQKTFCVGDQTPSKTRYYLKEKDSNTVYTVYTYKGESFLNSLDKYRDRTIFTLKPEEIVEFTISGKNRETIVVKEKVNKAEDTTGVLSTWDITEPILGSGSNENVYNLVLQNLPSITVMDFIEDSPSDLSKYGLDIPHYKLEFTDLNKKKETLLLGSEKDNAIFCKTPDGNSVYLISLSSVAFKDVNAFDLMEKFVYLVNIDYVDKIEIERDNKKSVMQILHNPKAAAGEKDESDTYMLNGQKASERMFKDIYQQIIGLIVDGELEKPVEGKPQLRYTFYHNNGAPNVTVEYVVVNDRNYAIIKNGECKYFIQKKKIDKMLEWLEDFEKNPMGKE